MYISPLPLLCCLLLTHCISHIVSQLNIAGVRLRDLSPNIGKDNDPDNFKTIHTEVSWTPCDKQLSFMPEQQ